jgi:hypothetical protein
VRSVNFSGHRFSGTLVEWSYYFSLPHLRAGLS